MRPRFFLVAVLLLSAVRVSHAMYPPDMSVPVPIDRLVENVSQYIKKHPSDAEGYYTLARVHSLAFAQSVLLPAPYVSVVRGTSETVENQVVGSPERAIKAVPVESPYHSGNKKLPDVEGFGSVTRDNPNQPVSSEDLYHVRESVRYYARAIALAPKDSLAWMGYGWMLEQGAPYAERLGTPWNKATKKTPSASSSQWLNQALAAYRRTYELQTRPSPGNNDRNASYDGLAIEAGESILRILAHPQHALTLRERTEAERIVLTIEKIKKRPMWITPLLVPLGQNTSLESLLDRQKSVTFDLSGDNLGKRWPWVNNNTGILVWDPQRQGKITSGRQLFGSVTWWIFWKNGYQALVALDNNGDGTLTGNELEGIAIWRDSNGNGVSDAGEVKSLSEWNITAVATRATDQVSGMPSNLRGITRADGSIVPSYDWTPRSLN